MKSSPPVIVFDQWVWIELSKPVGKRRPEFTQLLQQLRQLTEAGRIGVALTAGNYLELWNRANDTSRAAVAATMRELAEYRSLLELGAIRRLELERVADAVRARGTGGDAPLMIRPVTTAEVLGRA